MRTDGVAERALRALAAELTTAGAKIVERPDGTFYVDPEGAEIRLRVVMRSTRGGRHGTRQGS